MWRFMDIGEVAEFSPPEQQTVADAGLGSGDFLLLIDSEGAVVQSLEMVAAFMGFVANSALKARRIAVVRCGGRPGAFP